MIVVDLFIVFKFAIWLIIGIFIIGMFIIDGCIYYMIDTVILSRKIVFRIVISAVIGIVS